MRFAYLLLLLCGCAANAADFTYRIPPDRSLVVPPRAGNFRAWHCGMCSTLKTPSGYRIFLTGRITETGPFVIGYVDVNRGFEIIGESMYPVFEPNPAGHDSAGVLMPCIVDRDDYLVMYYVGAGKPRYPDDLNHRPMCAISRDGGETWKRRGGPLLALERDEESIGTHHVWREPDGWRMIYTSVIGIPPNRRYRLCYAKSSDGFHWRKPPNNIALDIPDRTCGRPCVWRDGERYLMTYSFSGGGVTYRICLAESVDGWHFKPIGQILDVRPGEFDSEMCEYAWVIPDSKPLRMLYSGNGWGRTGIGIATVKIPLPTVSKDHSGLSRGPDGK